MSRSKSRRKKGVTSRDLTLVSVSQALLVGEHLSFRRVATILGVRQSAVSRRVRELEDEQPLNTQTGNEFSAVLGFTYNFENVHTQYQNGLDMHLDWGASHFVTKQVAARRRRICLPANLL